MSTDNHEEYFPRGKALPAQSPLFWVDQKDRYIRQLLIRDIDLFVNNTRYHSKIGFGTLSMTLSTDIMLKKLRRKLLNKVLGGYVKDKAIAIATDVLSNNLKALTDDLARREISVRSAESELLNSELAKRKIEQQVQLSVKAYMLEEFSDFGN
jgi:hypothetical protein